MILTGVLVVVSTLLGIILVLKGSRFISYILIALGLIFCDIIVFIAVNYFSNFNINNTVNSSELYKTGIESLSHNLVSINNEILNCKKDSSNGQNSYNFIACMNGKYYVKSDAYELILKNITDSMNGMKNVYDLKDTKNAVILLNKSYKNENLIVKAIDTFLSGSNTMTGENTTE